MPEISHRRRRPTLLSDQDLYLFNEGSNYRILYETMGAHLVSRDGQAGAMFSVWAPNARLVSVIGSFNSWGRESNLLEPRGQLGNLGRIHPRRDQGRALQISH
jgi:1,4-alpha-glucan branching enzyme